MTTAPEAEDNRSSRRPASSRSRSLLAWLLVKAEVDHRAQRRLVAAFPSSTIVEPTAVTVKVFRITHHNVELRRRTSTVTTIRTRTCTRRSSLSKIRAINSSSLNSSSRTQRIGPLRRGSRSRSSRTVPAIAILGRRSRQSRASRSTLRGSMLLNARTHKASTSMTAQVTISRTGEPLQICRRTIASLEKHTRVVVMEVVVVARGASWIGSGSEARRGPINGDGSQIHTHTCGV